MNDNWLIESLKWTFEFWNSKQTEIWQLVSTTPEEFKGGDIWRLALTLNDGLKAIGYGLLVLFFALSICKSTINFRDLRRPEQGLRFFIRFVLAKTAVTYGIDLMTAIFNICTGIVSVMRRKWERLRRIWHCPKNWKRRSMRWDFLRVSLCGW